MTIALDRAHLGQTPKTTVAQPNRTTVGGLIDRGRVVNFAFDGKSLTGHPGDTLASALLANGVRLVGRSFKYHRPRGILTAGSEEPNALVELRKGARREPNTRATIIELFEGLEASSQNRWPSLRYDLLSINAALAPVFAAGFYYKTFMWPAAFWEKLYEPMIRRAAGLGRAADAPDPDHYEKNHAHCDVLVIGGGPTGLSAALAAARSGARVLLVDETDRLGGRLLSERRKIDGQSGGEWTAAAAAELAAMPDVQILTRTTLFGMYDHGQYGAIERVADHLAEVPAFLPRQRYWRIVAKRAIVAAGAIERPHVFGDNDRPGVMLASAVRTYVNRYGVLPGRRIAILTSSDDGWRTLADVTAGGAEVAAVIDTRSDVRPELRAMAESAAVQLMLGAHVVGTKGRPELRAIQVVDASGRSSTIACDCLAAANGWNPVVHFDAHLGKRPVWNAEIQAFVPNGEGVGHTTAGAAAGAFTLQQSLQMGAAAGLEAARRCGFAKSNAPVAYSTDPEFGGHEAIWRASNVRGKAFVDFQNDVAASDVELAHREGFRAVEHLKRYTTLGMATDQGKTSNMSGLGIMAELTGQSVPQVGTTVFRPPYSPIALGAIAGHHRGEDFRPTRFTPSHAWARDHGAVFVTSGAWMRAAYFPQTGETDWLESVVREVKTVRSAVGVCDVSTFGKIDFQGPDAIKLIEAAYANPFGTLLVGKARYALLLREDGIVLDDGTIARLGNQHYVATASTANATRAMQHLEFVHQWLNPNLDVQMISVSEQWAQFAVAGPRSRDTLRKVVDDVDLSNEAFPFLAAREICIGGGIKARLFRISFSGELAYEVAVPARFGPAAWAGILEAGAEFGITPYGTEALSVMRIEKGHAATAELNGMTTARDLGLDKMLAKKKDYVGRLMKDRPAFTAADRPAFIGLKPVQKRDRIRAGSHVLGIGAAAQIANDEGFISSVAFSPELDQWIGLGFVKRGPLRIGERVRAYDPIRDGDVVCEICPACFVDPKEERLRG